MNARDAGNQVGIFAEGIGVGHVDEPDTAAGAVDVVSGREFMNGHQ
jgi:hypothetical protein